MGMLWSALFAAMPWLLDHRDLLLGDVSRIGCSAGRWVVRSAIRSFAKTETADPPRADAAREQSDRASTRSRAGATERDREH